MAVWLVRAGRHGEQQDFALERGLSVIGWDSMPDLAQFKTREEMKTACTQLYPDAKPNTVANWVGQLWAFSKRIEVGDLVVLPLKGQHAIAIGRATGPYKYVVNNPKGAKHSRPVEWITQDMPRDRFDQDLLYSLGAFMAVCQITRNRAEERIRALLAGKPLAPKPAPAGAEEKDVEDIAAPPDIEEYGLTQIRAHIRQKFAGHRLADLVNAVLVAQGYRTQVSPPGPDGGVDILAGRGPMGFDPPRLCVQVKSGDEQQDVKTMRELTGVMKDLGARQGLLVSWGGFKRTVHAEARRQFFDVRLWDAADLVSAVLEHYEQFPAELKAELPLKRVWALVPEEME